MTEINRAIRDKLQTIETLIVNSLRLQPPDDDECEVQLKLTMAKIAEMSSDYLGMNCVEAYDIEWDTDDEDPVKLGLPKSMMLCVAQCDPTDIDDEIANVLSDRSGWCVKSFKFKVL